MINKEKIGNMIVKEVKEFLSKYSDDTVVYADGCEGLYLIDKELCGSFKDITNKTCPSLHIKLIHKF